MRAHRKPLSAPGCVPAAPSPGCRMEGEEVGEQEAEQAHTMREALYVNFMKHVWIWPLLVVTLCCEHVICISLFGPEKHPMKSTLLFYVLQAETLRHREVKSFLQTHTAGRGKI